MSGDVQIDGPQGDPQTLMQLANQLDQHANNVGNLGANTLRTTQGIQSAADWTGAAASSYGAFTGNTAHAVSGLENPLHSVATSIRNYAAVLQKAQQRVADVISAANSAITADPASAQTHIAAAQQAAGDAEAEVKEAGDQAAGEVEEQKNAFDEFMDKIEPARTANDWCHLPFDATASDLWLDKQLEAWAKSAETGLKNAKSAQAALEKTLAQSFDGEVGNIAHDFDNGEASLEDVESAFAKYAADAKVATTAASDAVDTAQAGVNLAKIAGAASKLMGGLAIAGDALTVLKPEDHGTMCWVDRGAAVANAGATGVLLAINSADEIPVWGEAVAVGTGLYLAGDFLYHHVTWFRDACNSVGSGVATAAKAVASGVTSVAKSVASGISSAAHTIASWF